MLPDIYFQTHLEQVSVEQLEGFFQGWPTAPDAHTLYRILDKSHYRVLARSTETGQVVGFINAITDQVFYAYIPLLEVLPNYQKQGIGEALIQRMKALLASFYAIDLCCDHALCAYYERQGFHPVSGMILRNYEHQTGRSLI